MSSVRGIRPPLPLHAPTGATDHPTPIPPTIQDLADVPLRFPARCSASRPFPINSPTVPNLNPEVTNNLRKRKTALFLTILAAGSLLAGGLALAASPGSGSGSAAAFDTIQQVYNDIMSNYLTPPNPEVLAKGAIQGMLNVVGDPYTEYFSPTGYQGFMQGLNGNYAGIGIEIYGLGGYATIERVFPGSPAAAYLQAGDQIIAVNGTDTVGMSLSQVASLTKGQPGTQVTVTVQRPSTGGAAPQRLTFTLTRADVTIPAAGWQMLPGNIAYLSIYAFNSNTASQFQSALADAAAQHPSGYILDLRGNPGGIVQSAITVAQDLIPRGVITTVDQQGQPPQVYTSSSGQQLGAPLVVLVDGGTASAAEILTAALQDNNAGYVMGVTTYGKGVMQAIQPLPDGGTLKLTVAKWLTPDGTWIQGKGITPSYIVAGDQAGLSAAEEYLTKSPDLTLAVAAGSTAGTSNGESVLLPNAPFVQGKTVYLPLKAVASLLGAQVSWDKTSSTVILTRGTQVFDLPVGSAQGMLNQTPYALGAPVLDRNGTTFIPAGAFAALGAQVHIGQTGRCTLSI